MGRDRFARNGDTPFEKSVQLVEWIELRGQVKASTNDPMQNYTWNAFNVELTVKLSGTIYI